MGLINVIMGWKELIATYDEKIYHTTKSKLHRGNIKFKTSVDGGSSRSMGSNYGGNHQMVMYYVYVKKEDHSKAVFVMNS